jgi:K+-sensing histidine kinase KdpD
VALQGADAPAADRGLHELNARHERLIVLLLAGSEREILERSFVDLADLVEHVGAQIPSGTVTEPFRRIGTEGLFTTSPGVGLGLSIVRAVARAHGGDVHAQPRGGGGLVITVTFPAGT